LSPIGPDNLNAAVAAMSRTMRIGIALVIATLSCGMASAGDKCFSSVRALDAKIEQTEKSIPKIFDDPPSVIGPVGPAAGDNVGPVTQEVGLERYMPSPKEIRENAGNPFDYYYNPVTQEVGPETYTLSPKKIRENVGSPSDHYYNPVTQEK
jgi:hypothetical protein